MAHGFCYDTKGKPSPDGTCAGKTGYTCAGSTFGSCCSVYHYCGSGQDYCKNEKCLPGFGDCGLSSQYPTSSERPHHDTTPTPSPPTDEGESIAGLKERFAKSRSVSPGLVCPEANNTIYKSTCGAKFQVECAIDHAGGDISWSSNGFITEALEKCVEACARWPDCVDVSWVNQHRPGGACYLKGRVGEAKSAGHVAGARQIKTCDVSGPVATPDLHKPPFSTASPTVITLVSEDTTITTRGSAAASHILPSSLNTTTGLSPTTILSPSSSYLATSVITPKFIASSANVTASSLASATASASACAHSFPKRSSNTVLKREEIDPDCTPCAGQSGTLPYCGADHTTDSYKFTPKTCRTVYYNFDVTNTTLAPDGYSRIVLAVNGQVPGPTLEANWGDTVVVTVKNKLHDNGTSIHFHGIRQLNNSAHDGVPAITQCPIAPGDSFTYRWTATNYGTSWYHLHYAIQAWEGVAGPMVIHGPTSASWDVDAGTIMLQDWSHQTVDSMYDMEQDAVHGGPRTMDNGLINGMNTWGVEGTYNQTGKRFELGTKFEPGKTYLLRIINSAIQGTMKFYIDSHELEVINMDFTNIVPYKTDILNIQIGQRYMVLVKANQKPGNYWMRADSQKACAANHQSDDIKGIVRYAGAYNSTISPSSTAYNYTSECVDEPLTSLVPTAKLNAYNKDKIFTQDITVAANEENLFKWYLSGNTFYSKYEDPTLARVLANNTAPTYSGNLILDLPKMGEWIYIIVESVIPLNHPIHLHGHDFLILGTGKGTYTNQPLNLNNPPRRDTANMPAAGWLVIAFETDNPGAWLMHCHIGRFSIPFHSIAF
jgi:FtsP/CotA-like multicopper oxidase with cupredoxin domain